jgi:hypothetical protein
MLLAALLALAPAQDAGARKALEAIAAAARENAAKPEKVRLAGDALASLYVRKACGAATDAKSALLALAYALDPGQTLAKNPLTGEAFKGIETDDERKERLKAMGAPTLRGRADWLLHFLLSGALALLGGDEMAEAAGISKEVADAKAKERGKGTGFSFTDLLADYAGIAFAQWLGTKGALEACAKGFASEDFSPDPKDLCDGLTWSEFEKEWGGVKGEKFQEACAKLKVRVQGCKGYREE